jgi:hypothetical protein
MSYSQKCLEAAVTLVEECGENITTFTVNNSAVIVLSDPRMKIKLNRIVEALIESVLDEEDTPYLILPKEQIES